MQDNQVSSPLSNDQQYIKNMIEYFEQIEIEQVVKEREKTSGSFDFEAYHEARMKRINENKAFDASIH